MGPGPGSSCHVTGDLTTGRIDRESVHTFAGGSLDRAAHVRSDSERIARFLKSDSTRFLPFRGLDPLIVEGSPPSLGWLPRGEIDGLLEVELPALFLGIENDAARFAVALPETDQESDPGPEGSAFRGVREIAPLLRVPDASVVAMGRSLAAWNATHGHCSRCGSPASMTEAGHARRCTDDLCGTVQFPRTDPVVIMLIHRDGQCLLGRAIRAQRYPPGLHSCLAGYVEPGESIEEAVRRETWEEAGLRIGHVHYHSSQPWPFPSTLMIGCLAEARPGEARVDPAELESVRWFTRRELRRAVERWDVDEVLRVPPPLTIAHQLAKAWLAEGSGSDWPRP